MPPKNFTPKANKTVSMSREVIRAAKEYLASNKRSGARNFSELCERELASFLRAKGSKVPAYTK